jgi:hypothetical protein
LNIEDFEDGSIAQMDLTMVSELTATLGVERCAIENDLYRSLTSSY